MKIYRTFLWIILLPNLIASHEPIPPYLIECYLNDTLHGPQLPLSFKILLDIIGKAERTAATSINTRMFVSSLLHRFKYDGIERHSSIRVNLEGVLPYVASGFQRVKQQLLEDLIPGTADDFPVDALTVQERCALHAAVSNTVWRGDTRQVAQMTDLNRENTTRSVEKGVILTSYETIAFGTVIAAMAAALQPQNVPVKLLSAFPTPFHDDQDKYQWLKLIMSSTSELDNIWLATIAGELAEMVVYQGPLLGSNMTLGVTGVWDNTKKPELFYLLSDKNLEVTRAEITGAIDGYILAKNFKSWTTRFDNLRLSQILDMYYSSKGVIFDTKIRACERGRSFKYITSKKIITDQAYAVSQVLAYRNGIAYISDEALRKMVNQAVDKFSSYVNKNYLTRLPCERENALPRVEAVIIFDGSWSPEYTAEFLSLLLESLGVSEFGSKVGIIHGTTVNWILNVTDSIAAAHEAILSFPSMLWPTELNFEGIFNEINNYLTKSWTDRLENHIISSFGQVVIFISPQTMAREDQKQEIISSIENLRKNHPDVNILYCTTEKNVQSFKRLRLSREDHLIASSNIHDINDRILNIPRSLRPGLCKVNVTLGIRDQIEDYVEPYKSTVYRLDPRWRRNTKYVGVKVIAVGYGTLELCWWVQSKNSIQKEKFSCVELSGHSEFTITDYFRCKKDLNCPAIYYQVRGLSSLNKCTEFGCRAPDYIRYLMRLEDFHCSKGRIFVPSAFKFMMGLIIFIEWHFIGCEF